MRSRIGWMVALSCLAQVSFATDLVTVYEDAVKQDTVLAQAKAQWEEAKATVPYYLAAALPSIDLTASTSRSFARTKMAGDQAYSRHTDHAYTYGISLTQSFFNLQAWNAVKQMRISAQQAQASYAAAVQNLAVRVANAYFGILTAHARYRYGMEYAHAIQLKLQQSLAHAKVGMATSAEVESAKAAFDRAVSQKIADRYAVDNAIETLAQITGKRYTTLQGLDNWLPMITPQPDNLSEWSARAKKDNLSLKAALLAEDAARTAIDVASSGRSPIITGKLAYGANAAAAPFATGGAQNLQQATTLSLNVDVPLYQGGSVGANIRRATQRYTYAASVAEATYRQVISQLRNSYFGVLTMISSAHANQQAIVSNKAALKAILAGYMAGTMTISEVLKSDADLYQVKTAYAQSRYGYLTHSLLLKQAAGMLSVKDLRGINRYLTHAICLKSAITPLSKSLHVEHRTVGLIQSKHPHTHQSIKAKPKHTHVKRAVVPHSKQHNRPDPDIVSAERAMGLASGVR